MKDRIDQIKNFGYDDTADVVVEQGYNAKMNEVQAAMGLLQLSHFQEVREKRKAIFSTYRSKLKNVIGIKYLNDIPDIIHNYAYFPIFINESKYGLSRDKLCDILKVYDIYARKYFYPLISNFKPYKYLSNTDSDKLVKANRIAEEVLCLPAYPELNLEDVERIAGIIIKKK